VSEPTSPAGPPAEITHLVRERTEARTRRDWARADALKAQIEAAGWRLVDHGGRTSLSPAAPPSLAVGGELRYGSASAVPSLLDGPATASWTVLVVASEEPDRVSRLLTALRGSAPDRTQVVVVANDPSESQAAALTADAPDRAAVGGIVLEVLRTSTRLGYAAALNVALRRCAGDLVLLADASAWPTGDALTPLAAALRDPEVAAAGGFGLYSPTPGPLRPNVLTRRPGGSIDEAGAATAPAAGIDPTALEGAWLAFRRSDYAVLGPLDERFVTPAWLDVWWTLRLRAGAEPAGLEDVETEEADAAESGVEESSPSPEQATSEAMAGGDSGEVELLAPRRAVRVELPLERVETAWPPERVRLNRRNMYRVLDRFGWRDDLG